MKTLYNDQNGDIYYVVKNAVWADGFRHTTNIPLTLYNGPDEVATVGTKDDPATDNVQRNIDLQKHTIFSGRVDEAGLAKYYIVDGELHELEDWEEDFDAES